MSNPKATSKDSRKSTPEKQGQPPKARKLSASFLEDTKKLQEQFPSYHDMLKSITDKRPEPDCKLEMNQKTPQRLEKAAIVLADRLDYVCEKFLVLKQVVTKSQKERADKEAELSRVQAELASAQSEAKSLKLKLEAPMTDEIARRGFLAALQEGDIHLQGLRFGAVEAERDDDEHVAVVDLAFYPHKENEDPWDRFLEHSIERHLADDNQLVEVDGYVSYDDDELEREPEEGRAEAEEEGEAEASAETQEESQGAPAADDAISWLEKVMNDSRSQESEKGTSSGQRGRKVRRGLLREKKHSSNAAPKAKGATARRRRRR